MKKLFYTSLLLTTSIFSGLTGCGSTSTTMITPVKISPTTPSPKQSQQNTTSSHVHFPHDKLLFGTYPQLHRANQYPFQTAPYLKQPIKKKQLPFGTYPHLTQAERKEPQYYYEKMTRPVPQSFIDNTRKQQQDMAKMITHIDTIHQTFRVAAQNNPDAAFSLRTLAHQKHIYQQAQINKQYRKASLHTKLILEYTMLATISRSYDALLTPTKENDYLNKSQQEMNKYHKYAQKLFKAYKADNYKWEIAASKLLRKIKRANNKFITNTGYQYLDAPSITPQHKQYSIAQYTRNHNKLYKLSQEYLATK